MNLKLLYEDLGTDILNGIDKYQFKKMQDPNRPEDTGYSGNTTLPYRSGNQYTPPSKARHRQFMNTGDESSTPDNPGLYPDFKSGELQGRAKETSMKGDEYEDTDEYEEVEEIDTEEADELLSMLIDRS